MNDSTAPGRLRLGMVGGGVNSLIGNVHRLAARLDGDWDLVAGALSSDPDRARESARREGLAEDRTYTDYREMARREAGRSDGIDAVAVVTPNHLHFPVAGAFIEAGIPVICDKPMTTTLTDAVALRDLVARHRLPFAVTYNYSGYPLVRQARSMVEGGELGDIRLVQMEYVQDWLGEPIERSGQKQASWRTNPEFAGPAGSMGDIGTHAFHLGSFISGESVESVAAEAMAFVDGRRLDDNVHAMMRFRSGARGLLWASQVATGRENGLSVRVHGTEGGLEFRQEQPNELVVYRKGRSPERVTKAGPGSHPRAAQACRLPPGHPEGYLEAFARLYHDFAARVRAHHDNTTTPESASWLPSLEDGLLGVAMVEAVVESSTRDGAWSPIRVP